MIKDKGYGEWSLEFHAGHAKKPMAVQMELTYSCPVRCLHCYTGCYNSREYARGELTTDGFKKIMDDLKNAGCLWLTLTGGDPLIRPDFIKLYDYAKEKGFIVSVMTSLVFLRDDILKRMIESPPFIISMTLNGATKGTYERISQVGGSFNKVISNIDRVLSAGLPLKIKTLISKNNIHEKDMIREFIESKGLNFLPSSFINAGLNGDKAPCGYRLTLDSPAAVDYPEAECASSPAMEEDEGKDVDANSKPKENRLFMCGAGTWQWYVNPFGRLNICSCLREPYADLLKHDLRKSLKRLTDYVRSRKFRQNSECRSCSIRYLCLSCPGNAKLETGDEEAPVPYFCRLAKKKAEGLGIGMRKQAAAKTQTSVTNG